MTILRIILFPNHVFLTGDFYGLFCHFLLDCGPLLFFYLLDCGPLLFFYLFQLLIMQFEVQLVVSCLMKR